ncbi:MAG: tryptophan-rich sensory protein [Candidatus Tectomicrobia bacterium]|uniref:Tryptophan-rich sensory protein n=1 Tax=Tectimicrobiota bacterium TaxID=2528274 RepID=A0A938B2D6_UNCTE|nr:tryptophan-rich sensory protein [Candidatus Tectomicrobia bacterium]
MWPERAVNGSALRQHWCSLSVLLVVCLAVMALGALVTRPAIAGWYAQLAKPAWTPPKEIFGPVWTLLYLGMAIAAWLVWCQRHTCAIAWPLGLFTVQLVLNGAWSYCFFGQHNLLAALVDIVLLWCSIVATLLAFWRVRPLAGWLLVPYLLWVTYAVALNAAIWRLNV